MGPKPTMGKESSLTGIYFVSKLYTLSPACATSDTVVKDAQNIPRGPCTEPYNKRL